MKRNMFISALEYQRQNQLCHIYCILHSGVNLSSILYFQVVTENYTDNYSQGEFCIHFTNSATEFNNQTSEDAIRPVFSVCQAELTEQEMEDREKTQKFYPVLIFISSFFLFVTLVVYCMLQ